MRRRPYLVPLVPSQGGYIPSDRECFELWKQYHMMEHIRKHSLMVAEIATWIAIKLKQKNIRVNVECVRAAALLHDIAKTYTIRNGGYHTQLGSVWMLNETKNYALSQGILHHVYWPGPLDIEKYPLPLILIYADKRVKHHMVVSLKERMQYILQRYGKSYERMQRILYSFNQAHMLEKKLSKIMEVNLDAYTFDSRGMVC